MMAAMSLQAQTERPDDFKARYELKEVVVMSRHNIRSPLTSGGAAYMRVTPYEWFKWTSPSSQLSLEEPPMVQTVTVEGLTANSDGLYRLADLDSRMAGAMAEYDAIEDAPTAVSSAVRAVTTSEGRSYTLSGTPANASTRGIVIRNDKKIISSK